MKRDVLNLYFKQVVASVRIKRIVMCIDWPWNWLPRVWHCLEACWERPSRYAQWSLPTPSPLRSRCKPPPRCCTPGTCLGSPEWISAPSCFCRTRLEHPPEEKHSLTVTGCEYTWWSHISCVMHFTTHGSAIRHNLCVQLSTSANNFEICYYSRVIRKIITAYVRWRI